LAAATTQKDGRAWADPASTPLSAASRDPAFAGALGAAFGSLVAAGVDKAGAKKKKKVTLCLDGRTIKARKKLLESGAALGASAVQSAPPPPPPGSTTTTTPAPTCRDGLRNGGESDVDCGGPDCARCGFTLHCQKPPRTYAGFICASAHCEAPNQCGPLLS
jgi:hypothetical protein